MIENYIYSTGQMLSNLSYAHPFFPMSFLSKIRLENGLEFFQDLTD